MTSLTLKPGLLRADTIDLQPHEKPSAQDHSRGQYHAGYSHAGPHHVQTLRSANHDALQEQQTSPRLGGLPPSLGPQGQTPMYDEGEDDEEEEPLHGGMNGMSHEDGYGDEDGDSQDDDLDDELLDKISSSPSIEDEDIDFEFVYALHTFVATVEGQANATKGETMVLLDDSNSYWWLVRVVKDGSIGYLPAEHIETPTERLARLNKHRNIDLAAAMLGDNPEKSMNPLKKAMRRRNAKQVSFAPPTFYEPVDADWSDEDDGDEMEDRLGTPGENGVAEPAQQESQQAQSLQHKPQAQQAPTTNPTADQQRAQPASATIHQIAADEEMDEDEPSSPVKPEAPAPLQPHSHANVSRSRNGTVRNTDSFFKDQETKKMTLTPRLLRNDNDATTPDPEITQRPSLDAFDKVVGEDKSKDAKKKEKKGMLSGLFKRKDKSPKASKVDLDEGERVSEDSNRSLAKDSMDSDYTAERKPSKLQKTNPSTASPKPSPTEVSAPPREASPAVPQQQAQVAAHGPGEPPRATAPAHLAPEQNPPSRFPSLQDKRSVFAPITGALRSRSSSQDMDDGTIKPVYSKRAKERFAIDESDSEDDSTPTAHSSILHRSISPLENNDLARPDSAIRVSPSEPPEGAQQLPPRSPLADDTTEVREIEQPASHDTPTSPSDQTASTSKQSPSIPTHTPSTSRSTPTWSDASLRSYMDHDQDIRDLLVIVHDKTNVTPVGPEHPLMNGLFASERTKLADMQSHLDSLLMDWLTKKNQPVTARV